MNNFIVTAFALFLVSAVTAQTGTIYNLSVQIDQELVTETKVQNKDHKILNIATVEEMPKELSDTIAYISEMILGDNLSVTMSSMMPEEKMIMGALPEHLHYLPANTFNKAVKTDDSHKYYVNIQCHIEASGGTKITLGNNKSSKVKPKVSLTVIVYDVNKEQVDKRQATLKDFEKLRSHTFEKSYGVLGLAEFTDEVTISETINSNDVLKMYVMALDEAYKE